MVVPEAMTKLSPLPNQLTDEQVLGPGGTLSSLRAFSGDLSIPPTHSSGLGDNRIVTASAQVEKNVCMTDVIASGRENPTPLTARRCDVVIPMSKHALVHE